MRCDRGGWMFRVERCGALKGARLRRPMIVTSSAIGDARPTFLSALVSNRAYFRRLDATADRQGVGNKTMLNMPKALISREYCSLERETAVSVPCVGDKNLCLASVADLGSYGGILWRQAQAQTRHVGAEGEQGA